MTGYKVTVSDGVTNGGKNKITLTHSTHNHAEVYELMYNPKTGAVTTGPEERGLSDDTEAPADVKKVIVEFFKHKGGARTRRVRRKKRSTRR